MNVLLITTCLPHQMKNGAETATMNFIAAIRAAGHRCDTLGYSRADDITGAPDGFHSAGAWPIEVENAGAMAGLWLARALLTRQPFITTKFRSAKFRAAMQELLAATTYDVVIVNHAHMSWVLGEPNLPRRRIFVAHNVEWQLYAQMAMDPEVGSARRFVYDREWRLVQALETRLARSSEQIWTLTEADARRFVELGAHTQPVVLDLPGQVFAPQDIPAEPQTDIGILGNWAWEINRKGLEWFIEAVAPLIPAHLSVEIGGSRADLVANPYRNVRYQGFVPDAAGFLRNCRVLAVPTVVGGGVQIKTIEGISVGVPMVATPLGLRGIASAPAFVHVEADAARFAARLVELASARTPTDTSAGPRWAEDRRAHFHHSIRMALQAFETPVHILEEAL